MIETAGGKNAPHANKNAKESAHQKYEALKKELDELEKKRNKTPKDKEMIDKLAKQCKHQKAKAAGKEKHTVGSKRAISCGDKFMNMTLFTFIAEYFGGTYISQVESSSPKTAIKTWAESLDPSDIKGLGAKSKQQLIRDAALAEPVSVIELRSVWCDCFQIRGHLMLVHFTRTSA